MRRRPPWVKDAALQDGAVQENPLMMAEMKVAVLFAALVVIQLSLSHEVPLNQWE